MEQAAVRVCDNVGVEVDVDFSRAQNDSVDGVVYEPTSGDLGYGYIPSVPSDKIGPTTVQVASISGSGRISAFAYRTSTNGRLYYQWHPFGHNPQYTNQVFELYLAGMKWAAGK